MTSRHEESLDPGWLSGGWHAAHEMTPSLSKEQPPTVSGVDDQQVERLREAAVDATARGWAVVPGTWLNGRRQWRGRDGAQSLCPASPAWQRELITDSRVVSAVWSSYPYGLLLACDTVVAALELPRSLGTSVFPVLAVRDVVGPVIEVGDRWTLLMAAGPSPTQLGAALVRAHPSMIVRGRGYWVALPPTPAGTSGASWYVEPSQRPLPRQGDVLRAVADTLLPKRRP